MFTYMIYLGDPSHLGKACKVSGESSSFYESSDILRSVCVCVCVCVQLLQSRLTPCDPMDCSPSGSSVPGILEARILKQVAMPSSSESS